MSLDVQALASALAQANAQLLTGLTNTMTPMFEAIVKSQAAIQETIAQVPSRGRGQLVDNRGIGKPETFNGDQAAWREWKHKAYSYITALEPDAVRYLNWAVEMEEKITDDRIMEAASRSNQDPQRALEFSAQLNSWLTNWCKGPAFDKVEASCNNGLQAWRELHLRYSPKTPGTKRSLITAILSFKPVKEPEYLEKAIMSFEELVRRYDGMSKTPLDQDVKAASLLNMCPPAIKEYLDMSHSKDFEYDELRSTILSWVERKRERDPKLIKEFERKNTESTPMDVDYLREHGYWHPGAQWNGEAWSAGEMQQELYETQWYDAQEDLQWGANLSYVNTGKGKAGKGFAYAKGYKGKGPFATKGAGLGGAKGAGKSNAVKGKGLKGSKGGVFHGHCYVCGEYGHSQQRCPYNHQYHQAGNASPGKGANSLEEQAAQAPQENTQPSSTHQDLSGLEETATANGLWRCWKDIGVLEVHNRFSPLATDGEDDPGTVASHDTPEVYPTISQSLAAQDVRKRSMPRPHGKFARMSLGEACLTQTRSLDQNEAKGESEISSLSATELGSVGASSDDLTITIDSGAAESVVGAGMAPTIPTTTSPGSIAGVEYVAANGSRMKNQGQKHIPVFTEAGQRCRLRMQVTDVKKPLLSVSRICDTGHRVIFDKQGGYIEANDTGERFNFIRENGVYRMRVKVAKVAQAPDFNRQG